VYGINLVPTERKKPNNSKYLMNLIQNSPAVKKCTAQKRPLLKKNYCEIQGGDQEMAVMVS